MRRTRILIAALTLSTIGCASVNPEPDQAALGYTGGPMQGTHFRDVFEPGSGLHWLGIFDGSYLYPTTVRTYIVSSEQGEGDKATVDSIAAPTKDGITVSWELAITFKLNVSRLRKFHESIGLTRHAYFEKGAPSAGWSQMLNDFFRQQVENALQDVSRTFTADEVWRGADTFAKINGALAGSLKDRINDSAGGNYFCGPTFNGHVAEDDTKVDCPNMQVAIKKVSLPEGIVSSYAAQKVAENAKITATNNGDATVIEAQKRAQAAAELQKLYTDPAYIAYLQASAMKDCASNNDKCTLVITQSPGGVNVNVK